MTNVTSGSNVERVKVFQSLDIDEQLGLFWFIYTEMGNSITPAAPGASTASSGIAEALFDRVKGMSHDEQLQLMRGLIARENSLIAREYGSLSDTTKLLFWYLLAQGMSESVVVPVPEDYKLSEEAQSLFEQIKSLEFPQQITLFRDIVGPMGVDPNEVPHDEATGL